MDPRSPEVARLYAELGLQPLNRLWAKVEILLGLCAAGLGLLLGDWAVGRAAGETGWLSAAAGLVLFVLGSYLAMAGHRSHLYQSNNYLTACLMDEMKRVQKGSAV